ncbi:MAG: exodeoxyribonuclease VII, large subunit [Candidatus Campylobacter infans]|nr:MAG: exodeoxyribonuclease VII, large subunit [Candidatus Campylobacter infans]
MTITELNLAASALLESHYNDVEIEGEISRFIRHSSGHWYFVLKDEKSSISATMFKGANSRVNFALKDGLKVIGRGKLSIYSPSGNYQINLTSLKLAGSGDLDAAFNALCEKLKFQGLIKQKDAKTFEKVGKKSLPQFPKRVGIVTSLSSAAFADILNRIKARGYFLSKFLSFDTLVQGANAPHSIINALEMADGAGLDVIILARGGGSKEDLWCFNDESLARTILALKTPIISAIGHEIDYTISDFVSDHRSITPTASIEDLLPNGADLAQFIDNMANELNEVMQEKLNALNSQLNYEMRLLTSVSVDSKISVFNAKILNSQNNMQNALDTRFNRYKHNLEKCELLLKSKQEYFNKAKDLVSIYKNEQKISLDKLKAGDEVMLKSPFATKSALIKGDVNESEKF